MLVRKATSLASSLSLTAIEEKDCATSTSVEERFESLICTVELLLLLIVVRHSVDGVGGAEEEATNTAANGVDGTGKEGSNAAHK